jgi:RNA polymerase sigma-70 factor (ECF subfamily)
MRIETAAAKTIRERHSEFETLAARTQHRAYQMAYRLTGSREEAEDLTQDAYLRAYRFFPTFDPHSSFESWFFRILLNRFFDLLRHRLKRKPLSLDQSVGSEEDDDSLLLEIPDETHNPERILMERVMDEQLQTVLATLPEPFRRAVLLCDVEGLSYEEIAQTMGTSEGTVRSRIHRGRQRLRNQLQSIKAFFLA